MSVNIHKTNEIKNLIRLLNTIFNTIYFRIDNKFYFEGMDIFGKIYIKIEYNNAILDCDNIKGSLKLNELHKILKFSNYKSNIEFIFKNNIHINIYNINITKKFVIPMSHEYSNTTINFNYKNKLKLNSKLFYDIFYKCKGISNLIEINIKENEIIITSTGDFFNSKIQININQTEKINYFIKIDNRILLNLLKLYKFSDYFNLEFEDSKPLKVSFINEEFNFEAYLLNEL